MDPSAILGQSCTAWPTSRQAKQVVLAFRSAIRLRRRFSEASLCSIGSLDEIEASGDRDGRRTSYSPHLRLPPFSLFVRGLVRLPFRPFPVNFPSVLTAIGAPGCNLRASLFPWSSLPLLLGRWPIDATTLVCGFAALGIRYVSRRFVSGSPGWWICVGVLQVNFIVVKCRFDVCPLSSKICYTRHEGSL